MRAGLSDERRQRRAENSTVGPFLTIALLAHAVALFVFLVSFRRSPSGPAGLTDASGQPLDVTWVDPETLTPPPPTAHAARATAKERAKAAQAQPSPPMPSEAHPEVVENGRPAIEKAPAHSRFVSEYDVSTDHETRAKLTPNVSPTPGTTLLPNVPPPEAAPQAAARPTAPKAPPVQGAGQGSGKATGSGTAPLPSPLAMRGPEGGGSADRLVPSPNGDVPLPKPGGGGAPTASGGAAGSLPPISALTPTDDAVARSTGTPVNDYLPELDEGNETLVNSRHWKYASFFNRVKRAVAERWHPDVDYRRRDPDGSVYGLRDRYTVLTVTLNPDGSLASIAISSPCGVDFLDDDAVNAFRLAAPFPNPPTELVDPKRGTIQFKFGFMFEISGAPGIKDIFRTQ